MVMVVHKQQNSIIIIIPKNLCYYKLVLKSLPGGVPDQALLLAVGVAGHIAGLDFGCNLDQVSVKKSDVVGRGKNTERLQPRQETQCKIYTGVVG